MPKKRKLPPNEAQQLLIQLRSALGLTQEQLAREIGVTSVTVARWETRRPPGFESLHRLAEFASESGLDEIAAKFLDEKVEIGGKRSSIPFPNTERACRCLRELLRIEKNPRKRKLIEEAIGSIDLASLLRQFSGRI